MPTLMMWTEAVMTEQDHRILVAFMLAGYDIHSALDTMSGEDWDRALQILKVLDEDAYNAAVAEAEG